MQQTIYNQYNNPMQKGLINLFHSSELPLHFNKTGNKEFTNLQRISIIILFYRSKKSIRDFIDEDLTESKWISWLGLKKIPKKSTIHDWLKLFDLKLIRKIHQKILSSEKVEIASIDSTGFDSWQRSRHYEKRAEEIKPLKPMAYAKASLFIDVKKLTILDFDLTLSHRHDVKIAERIFKRNKIKNIFGLGDKGYDSENLHEIARANGIAFYADVRKNDKRSFSWKQPKGKHRRECRKNPPKFKGQRVMNETVNSILKRTQIHFLRSKKPFMKKREFGWQVILFNLKIESKEDSNFQTFLFFNFQIFVFPDRAEKTISLNTDKSMILLKNQ